MFNLIKLEFSPFIAGELDWISEFKVKQTEEEKTSKIKVGIGNLQVD